jgi:hypothetical protein
MMVLLPCRIGIIVTVAQLMPFIVKVQANPFSPLKVEAQHTKRKDNQEESWSRNQGNTQY